MTREANEALGDIISTIIVDVTLRVDVSGVPPEAEHLKPKAMNFAIVARPGFFFQYSYKF